MTNQESARDEAVKKWSELATEIKKFLDEQEYSADPGILATFVTMKKDVALMEQRERFIKIAESLMGFNCEAPDCDHNLAAFIEILKHKERYD